MSHNKPFANMKKHAFNKKVNRMQQASKRACTLINGVCHTLNCSFIHPNKQTSQPVSVTPISAARTEPELVDIGRKSLRGVDIRPAWMTNPHLYGDSTGATWSAKEVIPANKRKDISPQSKISMYDIDQGSDISFDARNSLRSADRRPDIFDTAPSTEFCEQQGIIKLQAALEERGMKRVAEPKWGNKNQINQITQAAAKRLFEHVTWQQTTAAKRSFARKELSPCCF